MQTALILFASAFAVTSAGIVSVVPVSYIAQPLPTYNHAQNTLTGEYAYNYAGGPSAKEEIKTLDGVTRGAYSYVDGFGIIQSAQYVADHDGFRVIATNVPTDARIGVNVPLETPEVQAAKAAHFAEHAKAIAALGRRKRSLAYAAPATAVSSQYHHQEHESVKIHAPVYEQYLAAAPVVQTYSNYLQPAPVAAVAVAPTAVSHQSRFQTHNSAHLEVSAPVEVVRAVPDQVVSYHEAVEVPAVQYVAPVASVPTAVSSQSRYQVHNNQKVEIHSPVYETVEAPVVPVAPVVPETESVVVEAYEAAPVPVAVASVPTAVSSQSRTQVHNGQRLEVLQAPHVYAAQVVDSYGHPAVAAPVYGPSHLVSQIPQDTPEVVAAKHAHAKAYAAELAKHQGW